MQADAVLFAFAHEVRSRRALDNVLAHVRPGGRMASAGPKWALLAPQLNPLVWQVARQSVTTFEGFTRPWSELERLAPQLTVEEAFFGCIYVAWGRLPDRQPGGPRGR